MRVRPPYLIDDRQSSAFGVVNDVATATVEVTVHGPWTRRLGVDITHLTRKCLAEHPAVVIFDLRDLHDPHGASAAMWLASRRAGLALRPPVQVALCLAPDDALAGRLRRLGTPRYLATYDSLAQARVSIAERRPSTDMLQWPLAAEPESAGVARRGLRLLHATAYAWGSMPTRSGKVVWAAVRDGPRR